MLFEPCDDVSIKAQHMRWPHNKRFTFPWCCEEGRAKDYRIDGEHRGWKLDCDAVDILIIRHGLDEGAMVIVERAESINNSKVVRIESYFPGWESLVQSVVA